MRAGAVETEFSLIRFKGDKDRAAAVYDGFAQITAADIADNIVYMATRWAACIAYNSNSHASICHSSSVLTTCLPLDSSYAVLLALQATQCTDR
jgi:hypothetical protein